MKRRGLLIGVASLVAGCSGQSPDNDTTTTLETTSPLTTTAATTARAPPTSAETEKETTTTKDQQTTTTQTPDPDAQERIERARTALNGAHDSYLFQLEGEDPTILSPIKDLEDYSSSTVTDPAVDVQSYCRLARETAIERQIRVIEQLEQIGRFFEFIGPLPRRRLQAFDAIEELLDRMEGRYYPSIESESENCRGWIARYVDDVSEYEGVELDSFDAYERLSLETVHEKEQDISDRSSAFDTFGDWAWDIGVVATDVQEAKEQASDGRYEQAYETLDDPRDVLDDLDDETDDTEMPGALDEKRRRFHDYVRDIQDEVEDLALVYRNQ